MWKANDAMHRKTLARRDEHVVAVRVSSRANSSDFSFDAADCLSDISMYSPYSTGCFVWMIDNMYLKSMLIVL